MPLSRSKLCILRVLSLAFVSGDVIRCAVPFLWYPYIDWASQAFKVNRYEAPIVWSNESALLPKFDSKGSGGRHKTCGEKTVCQTTDEIIIQPVLQLQRQDAVGCGFGKKQGLRDRGRRWSAKSGRGRREERLEDRGGERPRERQGIETRVR
ncbi:hypothetical protein BJX68DRAFT_140050 [Aspergillus pseudodeflectus]|uniref:Uncharacterized protein n=1 Tax=Aspergillus pseudodeflectus TaxID=176178 RepID=A0ABR4L2C7_9EURO